MCLSRFWNVSTVKAGPNAISVATFAAVSSSSQIYSKYRTSIFASACLCFQTPIYVSKYFGLFGTYLGCYILSVYQVFSQLQWADPCTLQIFPVYSSGSQSVVPGATALASLRNLLEMQIFELHLRFTESETLGLGPEGLWLTSPSSNSNAASV